MRRESAARAGSDDNDDGTGHTPTTSDEPRAGAKSLSLADGSSVPFDGLLSTMPVVQLLRMTPDHPELARLAEGDNGAADHSRFKHQTVNLLGVGEKLKRSARSSLDDALDGMDSMAEKAKALKEGSAAKDALRARGEGEDGED